MELNKQSKTLQHFDNKDLKKFKKADLIEQVLLLQSYVKHLNK